MSEDLYTFETARDQIYSLFYEKWKAETPAINDGKVIRVDWKEVEPTTVQDVVEPFARISINHAISGQSTFNSTGQRRFSYEGIVAIQVFAPISRNQVLPFAEKMATIAKSSFLGVGTAKGLWFRNTRIEEVGRTEGWYQMNVLSDFQYDEIA